MDAFSGGNGGLWAWNFLLSHSKSSRNNKRRSFEPKSSNSLEATGGSGFRFPLKQYITAGCLTLSGDTIAQFIGRYRKGIALNSTALSDSASADKMNIFSEHDWIRSLRMASYGFLLYGPGSFAWYNYLDHVLPKKSVENLILKVVLNQIVLGPAVIGVVFAWNSLWLGKLSQLPEMYRKDALPTLSYGVRFWIPVSILNFWVVPLQGRVAFMSVASIFWNFYLSSTMSK
ncbi:protein sym-1 [Cucumis sativus]|uniref:Peroxisomal membrane protein n=1 Tax=Cucumis sativus TaxID=3659 RepID=A0A0A0KEM8_CUCSA|nr:protein sym-1 [Cucumis sativus]